MIENSPLLSITTFTPSCSTTSSNFPGFSTYSRWYDIPAQPLFRTPMRTIWGVGFLRRFRNRSTAVGVCLGVEGEVELYAYTERYVPK